MLGAFVKKKDNPRNKYDSIRDRQIPDFSNEKVLNIYLGLAEKVESELAKKVKKEGRKGTR